MNKLDTQSIIIVCIFVGIFILAFLADSNANTVTTHDCVEESEIPTGYPYIVWEGVKIIVVLDDLGEKIPVKVCEV